MVIDADINIHTNIDIHTKINISIKFMKPRIDGLAACRGAGAKEVKRTAVVCHQKFQEITAKIPGNTGKIAGNTVKYTRKCQNTGKAHKEYQEMPQKKGTQLFLGGKIQTISDLFSILKHVLGFQNHIGTLQQKHDL